MTLNKKEKRVAGKAKTKEQNPLLIGSSGGGGHIAAINAIAEKFQKEGITLRQHIPTPYSKERIQKSFTYKQIMWNLKWTYFSWLSRFIRWILPKTPLPLLPHPKQLKEEIATLQKNNQQARPYVDMLLDLHDVGYETTAIYNVLNRNDSTEELKKLLKFQKLNDLSHYSAIRDKFLQLLNQAKAEGTPYTEIISTQVLGLAALCDAVIEYNQANPSLPPLKIKQYMTDLPTKGAVHIFKPLSSLSRKQRQQMSLHGVNIDNHILYHFNVHYPPFAAINPIHSTQNVMVRSGFYNPALKDISSVANMTLETQVKGKANAKHTIKANAKVASIMLGSQAGIDTVEYVSQLLKLDYDKIFVFGGKTTAIYAKLEKIIAEHPKYTKKIIALDNQDDKHIAPIMTRSNLVIIRGGGLSVMEQMAMPHSTQQTILIHHKEKGAKKLASGISWEDKNTEMLIDYFKKKGISAKKTTPKRIINDLKTPPSNALSHKPQSLNEFIGKNIRLFLENPLMRKPVIQNKKKNSPTR